MRIGIDCRTILNPESGERAGVGHYTYHLVKALLAIDPDNQYVLFFDARMKAEGTQEFEQSNVTIRFFPFSRYRKFLPFAYSHMLTAAALARERLDVFHAPANVIPLSYRGTSVLTIHDLAIYRHPEWFQTQVMSTHLLVPRSIRKAKQVIAVSQATKRDLRELFHLAEQKVSVVPEAVDVQLLPLEDSQDDVRTLYRLPERFLLFIGTIEPRKNISRLIEAWQHLRLLDPETTNGTKLVLAGGLGYHGRDILTPVRAMDLDIQYLDYVSHNHKIQLLQEATAFVFPSLYEGFGLPVLEAMALGTPVITTKTSAIPEVTGQAAILVDPDDMDGLAAAMGHILRDPRRAAEMAALGRDQARNFSWAQTAEQTLDVYRRAAA